MVAASLIKSVKQGFRSIKSWIRKNPQEALLLTIILALGAFLRLYKIGEYMTFLGDEGRDVIIVRRLLVYFDPILVGPGTSIGNMYLGPLYYYLIAPALLLANFSPVGPAVLIAVIGIFTIFLLWFIAKSWFGKIPALLVAALFATSPTVVIFSKASWNPNIMPFFSLLSVWAIWKIWKDKSYNWFLVLGVSLAFILNSHYLGLLLFPVIFIYWYKSLKEARKVGESRSFLRSTGYCLLILAFLMSPLVIFDARHEFRNFKAMQEFIAHRESSFKGLSGALTDIWSVFVNVFTRLISGRNIVVGFFVSIFVFISALHVFIAKRTRTPSYLVLLVLWVLIGVLGLAFVEREIYDHYMGFLFPAPFLLLAALVLELTTLKSLIPLVRNVFLGVVLAVCVLLFIFNLLNSPLMYPPNRQMARSQEVARKIMDEARGTKFNLAVLAERNYEDGYKYFLDVAGAEVLHADIWDKSTIADNLFVVCEKIKSECHPTTDAKAEVANFGMSKIDNEWEVGGVTLYKLSHNPL